SGASWKLANKNGTEFEISKAGTGGSEFRVTDAGAMTVGAGGAVANFAMDASGNITIQGALTQNSDINSKENISLVDTAEILNKVMNLPVSVWNYKFDDASVKHLGPMAQDFFKQFNLGGKEDKIASIDTSGVALASIKELGNQLQNKDIQIDKLQADNVSLNNRLEILEKAIESLQQ
ncbi:MAG: tail fiber domain-containing protein, partial [Proteobacteria bacterium]|nr:tail fiber domain-containing protein [Pseudomonadota bacterium]